MARTKLKRFEEIKDFDNVYESGTETNWADNIFKNSHPIVLELGCGKAKFSIQMATHFKQKNFVAIDRKGERIWRGAIDAQKLQLENLAFMQGNIYYIEKDFLPESISQIWITFPDPLPKPNNANKRLTHSKFLKRYKQLLTPNGSLHLKTDSLQLINFSIDEIEKFGGKITKTILDIYNTPDPIPEHLHFQTDFEKKFLAKNLPIYYLEATLS
jgi:tRNA (guanine-N7-)-methyltransferase